MIKTEELVKMLEENEQEIKEHFVEEVKKIISSKVEYGLGAEIRSLVETFVAEEVAPEVKSTLFEAKPAIMKAVVKMGESMSAEIAASLMKDLQENLKQSYSRKKLWEAMFD
jgi:aspartokinase